MPEGPQTVAGASGRVASDVIGGLKQQPMLLAIVVLNIMGIGAALYFLNKLATESNARFVSLMEYCLQANGVN